MLYKVYQRIGNPDIVEADMIRMQTQTGDMWFCDADDVGIDGNFQPKFVVARGEYLKVVQFETPKPETEINYVNEDKLHRAKRRYERNDPLNQ